MTRLNNIENLKRGDKIIMIRTVSAFAQFAETSEANTLEVVRVNKNTIEVHNVELNCNYKMRKDHDYGNAKFSYGEKKEYFVA